MPKKKVTDNNTNSNPINNLLNEEMDLKYYLQLLFNDNNENMRGVDYFDRYLRFYSLTRKQEVVSEDRILFPSSCSSE